MSHRPATRLTGDRHQPAHALGDLVVTRPIAIGPLLAKAGNAPVDQPGVDLGQGLVVNAETMLDVGSEVFNQYVGARDQLHQDREPTLILQVQRHRALVSVEVLEVRAVAGKILIGILDGLDLDDLRSHVGKLAYAGRSGPGAGQVQDGVVCQCQGHGQGHSQGHSQGQARCYSVRRRAPEETSAGKFSLMVARSSSKRNASEAI